MNVFHGASVKDRADVMPAEPVHPQIKAGIVMDIVPIVRKIFSLPIHFYRKFISPMKAPCCKYYPSCSRYALDAVEKHGIFKGTALSVWRVLRCNPWSVGGIDPVPEKFVFTVAGFEKRRATQSDESGI